MYKEKILSQSLAVRTNVLLDVRKVVDTVRPDYDSVTPYKTNVIEWLKPIIDLTGFSVYPTNGITEGLNWWMAHERRAVYMDLGDYQWVQETGNRYEDSIKYVSIPSAIDGNFREIPNHVPIALDLAYVGSTQVQKINLPNNVEHVFFSLSKSFGIRNIRTGWYFTRTPNLRLEALTHNAKYYNYYAHDVGESIISNFEVDFIHNQLYNKQKTICNRLDLTPSDSVWLATTQDNDYIKFMRGNKDARICLAGVIDEET